MFAVAEILFTPVHLLERPEVFVMANLSGQVVTSLIRLVVSLQCQNLLSLYGFKTSL